MEENKKDKKNKNLAIAIVIICIIVGVIIIGKIALANLERKDECKKNNIYDPIYSIDKPIIYLYPEETIELSVKLGYPEKITCSYPKYKEEWRVIASPDSTLKDVKTGRKLYSLYWEGKTDKQNINMNEGFVVKGEDSAKFLEEKLEILGLTPREAEEFIVYWLPKLESNKYNYIKFASTEEINNYMPLEFSVEPDTIIRVLMQYKGLNEKINVKEQKLSTPSRTGFVAVEWGGMEV